MSQQALKVVRKALLNTGTVNCAGHCSAVLRTAGRQKEERIVMALFDALVVSADIGLQDNFRESWRDTAEALYEFLSAHKEEYYVGRLIVPLCQDALYQLCDHVGYDLENSAWYASSALS